MLRRRNQLFLAVDGGSTTLLAIKELLEADKIPFEVPLTKNGTKPSDFRLVDPVLLTSSFPIVEAVTKSEKHRHQMAVEFIGGVSRPNRNCTTGTLSDLWLKACCGQ